MNSEKIKMMSFSPFVRELTFAVLKSIKTNKIVRDEYEVIDSELVPKVSKRVMEASLFLPQKPLPPIKIPKKQEIEKRIIFPPTRKILPPKPLQKIIAAPQIATPTPVPIKLSQKPKPVLLNPTPIVPTNSNDKYGKIELLLLDHSISTITCPGPGKQITVLRKGQKEMTRIVLTPQEIKDIINKVGESTHIPVIEGVFRAAVDNFSINAVVSDMIGSRFIIKKDTPYAMLEKH